MAERRRRRGHSGDERERKCIIPSDQGILRIHTGECRASEAVSPPVQSSSSILRQGALTTTQPCIQTHKTLLLYLQQYRATTVHFTLQRHLHQFRTTSEQQLASPSSSFCPKSLSEVHTPYQEFTTTSYLFSPCNNSRQSCSGVKE